MVLLHTRLGTLGATAFALMLAGYLHGKLGPGLPQQLLAAWLAAKLAVAGARMVLAWWWSRRGVLAGGSARCWPCWRWTARCGARAAC